jgi:hypothetical protein
MSESLSSQAPGSRSKQILKLLAEHGPLSSRTLQIILQPAIQSRRLRDSLKRLSDRGYISRRYDRIFGGAGCVYQITRDQDHWPAIHQQLGNADSEVFEQIYFSHRELHHMQSCAIWAEALRQWLPEAAVKRDHVYSRDQALLKDLMLKDSDSTLPDILLIVPTENPRVQVRVAVEIERTRKTERRLAQKLSKFAAKSCLDGVIYISESDRILDVIRAIYSSRLMKKALRISHYGQHFLMLSRGEKTQDGADLKMANATLGNMTLKTWLAELIAKSCNYRRDAAFLKQASSG